MIGYAMLGTNDVARALAFYDALFGVIGVGRMMDMGPRGCAYGTSMAAPALGIVAPFDGAPATAGNGTMVALSVDAPDKVDLLHAKALELGGTDEGAPGPRGPGDAFYTGYFRDLDGNKLAAFTMLGAL